ncbi:MAG: hypothetical protein LC107_06595 [Chitinophagales bacterium]|nr:hypothetical protein [Chitinophagales bacterium]
MKYINLSIILFFSVLISCKQSETQTTSDKASLTTKVLPVMEKYIFHNQFANNEDLIQQQRAAALSILDHRIKQVDPTMTNVLAKDMWHVDAFLRGSEMFFASDVHGFWFKFEDGHKYAYGSYKETYGTGKFVYTTDNNLLLLLDDDQRIKPQEFEVKYNESALVLVGQSTYGDNSMQIKMLRQANYPQKPAGEEWDGNGGDDVDE